MLGGVAHGLREFFENERNTSSDRRKGGATNLDIIPCRRSLKNHCFYSICETQASHFRTRGPEIDRTEVLLRKNDILGTNIDPTEAIAFRDFCEVFGRFWIRNGDGTDRETDRGTDRENDLERKRETVVKPAIPYF